MTQPMQLNPFKFKPDYIIGFHSGRPVPQNKDKLELIEKYPYPVYGRVGIEYNPKVIVKIIGFAAFSFYGALKKIRGGWADGLFMI